MVAGVGVVGGVEIGGEGEGRGHFFCGRGRGNVGGILGKEENRNVLILN